jgi:hypothetical protein
MPTPLASSIAEICNDTFAHCKLDTSAATADAANGEQASTEAVLSSGLPPHTMYLCPPGSELSRGRSGGSASPLSG